MRAAICFLGILLALPALAVDAPDALVDITAVAPAIRLDMRYAGSDNFLKRAVYAKPVCLLRREVAERLARVERRLAAEGYGLKLWDCYRPLSVQREMWKLVSDERYVADPKKGSRHNRGAAVDLTLVGSGGETLEMPTAHDDFSERAGRAAEPTWPATARKYYATLHRAMTAEGFLPLPSEWWHYDAPGWERHPLLDVPL